MRSVDERLERAREHIFACGVDDAAEQLGLANMAFGLAKIQHVEQQLGLEPRATFIGAPDATVTRNTRRWAAGFGYGGQVRWSPEIAVLDALPNACGMLVGALARAPSEAETRQAAAAAREAELELDGVELEYDLGDSNHFVDACELEQVLSDDPELALPAELFVIHSSGHEHRARSPYGPGLYVHLSAELSAAAERHATPWGELSLLRGEQAARFFGFCEQVQAFNARRRTLYAERLFGTHRSVCNLTHQGIRAPGVFHLGSYWFDRDEQPTPLFPLTLGPDQPVFLLRPRPSFSEHVIETLGWSERGERLGLGDALRSADILPHGGGYAYPALAGLREVRGDHRRTFVLERAGAERGTPALHLEAIRPEPFAYRGLEVLERLLELELAEVVARYRVRFVIKGE